MADERDHMKIEASGPNGETFEAELDDLVRSGTYSQEYEEHAKRRIVLLEALEKWCQMIRDTSPAIQR